MVIYEYWTPAWGNKRYRTRCSYCRSQFSSHGRTPLFNYMKSHHQICGPAGDYERRMGIRLAILERKERQAKEAWELFFEGTV